MNAMTSDDEFWLGLASQVGGLPFEPRDILPIVRYGHPILESLCDEVVPSGEVIMTLYRMYETLKNARGVGLAAPQVLLKQRLVVIRTNHPLMVEDLPFTEGKPLLMLNPRIISASAEMMMWEDEACLSMPGFRGSTRRHRWVEVAYTDCFGRERQLRTRSSLLSACVQHELQHLNGEMFWSKIPEFDSLWLQKLQWEDIQRVQRIGPLRYPMVWLEDTSVHIGREMFDAFYKLAPHVNRVVTH